MAYVLVLETRFCGFDSHLAYSIRVWNPFNSTEVELKKNLARVYKLFYSKLCDEGGDGNEKTNKEDNSRRFLYLILIAAIKISVKGAII